MSSPLKQNTTTIQNLLNKINELPEAGGGVELPELTNEGSASDLLSGKQLIDGDGNVVTGTIPTQATKTITPSTSSQTAVASGRYTTGAVTVAGDTNLKAENIKSGVSIFGVSGTHSGFEDLDTELTTQENLISQLSTILDSKASGGSGGGMEYEIVNLAEETTSIPFTLKRVTSTFGMMTTSGQGGMSIKNVAHYNLSGMSAIYQGIVVSFLRPLSCENGALTSSINFVAPYVAIFINDPSKEAIYEE